MRQLLKDFKEIVIHKIAIESISKNSTANIGWLKNIGFPSKR